MEELDYRKIRQIMWSDKHYRLRELPDFYGFPLIIKVQSLTKSAENKDTFSKGEILRIDGEEKQRRLMAVDSAGRHWSFPVHIGAKFDVPSKKEKKRRSAIFMSEMVEEEKLPKKFSFTKKDGMEIQISGEDPGNAAPVIEGNFETKDVIQVRIFKANRITDEEIDPHVVFLPAYMDMEVTIATKIACERDDFWDDYMEAITNDIRSKVNLNMYRGKADIQIYEVSAKTLKKTKSSASLSGMYEDISPTKTVLISNIRRQRRSTKFRTPSMSSSSSSNSQMTTFAPAEKEEEEPSRPVLEVLNDSMAKPEDEMTEEELRVKRHRERMLALLARDEEEEREEMRRQQQEEEERERNNGGDEEDGTRSNGGDEGEGAPNHGGGEGEGAPSNGADEADLAESSSDQGSNSSTKGDVSSDTLSNEDSVFVADTPKSRPPVPARVDIKPTTSLSDSRPTPNPTVPSRTDFRPTPSPSDSRPAPNPTVPARIDFRPTPSPSESRPAPNPTVPARTDFRPTPVPTAPARMDSHPSPIPTAPARMDSRPSPIPKTAILLPSLHKKEGPVGPGKLAPKPAAKPKPVVTPKPPPRPPVVPNAPTSTSRAPTGNVTAEHGPFTSIHDFPSNLEGLTIDDICKALQYLHLDRYTGTFRTHKIDGDMAKELTEDMLKSELGIGGLDAKKVFKFIHHNWRPV